MSVTLYQQIAQDLVGKVRSGELPVGSLLPTELQLMEAYGASRNTVRSALDRLQDMGMISRRRNRGTMVEAPPAAGTFTQSMSTLEDLVSLAQTAQRNVEGGGEVVLDINSARELRCPPGSRWLHIAMTRRQQGAALPLVWTDAYVDPHYKNVRRLAAKHPDMLLGDLIETHYGRPIATVEQTVSGCAIDDRLADKLEAKTGSPGLKILRHYRDGARVVVLATRSVYPADRYSLTTTLVRTKEAPRKE
ncbi:MAG: GntR family transcriptional regulator [Methylibium sp.]|uniref:GntR family transcriptional regulator n=1 Tax=Methylibium sp. TaxID=2067992 RepID=UPI001804EF00|nr:GntR family transcriptional regulator [Methylibium sp.]MBA3599546.1 GntR family transcriptional regulator [Methylibium sp.]